MKLHEATPPAPMPVHKPIRQDFTLTPWVKGLLLSVLNQSVKEAVALIFILKMEMFGGAP